MSLYLVDAPLIELKEAGQGIESQLLSLDIFARSQELYDFSQDCPGREKSEICTNLKVDANAQTIDPTLLALDDQMFELQ
jgi:hypothetical protein